jgi:hypothetical protein
MDPNRPRSSSTSTLGWLGCGCGALVALALAAIIGMTWFGYRKGKEMERTFKDPQARREATREVLPWRELPEGYYPAGAVTIPMLMRMAILSDHEPEAGEAGHGRAFQEHGLVFMSFTGWISNEQELLRWLRGELKETPKWLRRSDAKINPDQVLQRGSVESNGHTVLYVVSRGDAEDLPARVEPPADPGKVEAEREVPAEDIPEEVPETTDLGAAGPESEAEPEHNPREDSLMIFFSVDCPGDKRARLGVWFAPDPAPGRPNAEVDLAGTIGDPAVIREFVGHFELCK